MIDLHLHTYYSDGTMSPEELVILAKKSGVTTIAITDHDGMDGLSEGLEAGRRRGVRVIPGIELSAADDEGIYTHILGYCFDRENEELKKELEWIRQKRAERNEKMLAALREVGCRLSKEDLQLRKEQDYVGKPTFALALMRKGYISSPKEAFREGQFMRSAAVRSVHREKLPVDRAIELIKGAGGTPVLAHPMKISRLGREGGDGFFEKLDSLLAGLKRRGLEGMECYYSSHLPGDTERLVLMAKKHGLLITAGSDFHGTELDKNITVGGFYVDEGFNEQKIVSALTKEE